MRETMAKLGKWAATLLAILLVRGSAFGMSSRLAALVPVQMMGERAAHGQEILLHQSPAPHEEHTFSRGAVTT